MTTNPDNNDYDDYSYYSHNTDKLPTTAELTEHYPSLSSYYLQQNITNCDVIFKISNQTNNDKDEVEYLEQYQHFLMNNYYGEITKINRKKKMIERIKNFDCSKIQNLPKDLIKEIKSYLEPELNYVRKFSILRKLDMLEFSWWRDVETYLWKVPKKLIIATKESCCIFPCNSVASKDNKEKWCRMIMNETSRLFSKKHDGMRVDKLFGVKQDTEFGVKQIDKWFKFFLYIHTFKKYRAKLESNKKQTNTKIYSLKNKKIVVK
jgi:hypothetical protein